MLMSYPFDPRKDHVFKDDGDGLEEEEMQNAAIGTRTGVYQTREEKGDTDLKVI